MSCYDVEHGMTLREMAQDELEREFMEVETNKAWRHLVMGDWPFASIR